MSIPSTAERGSALGGRFATLHAITRRALLRRTTFVAVTGSASKTTTKTLIGAVLAARAPTRVSDSSWNSPDAVRSTLRRTQPWHRFCVQETPAPVRGWLAASLRLLRPQIGVVTLIDRDHLRTYRTLDDVAAEKGKLVEALPPSGVAVLNADDARVLALRERTRASVLTYGLSDDADVRAEDVTAAWPERLSFTVSHRGARVSVRTRLVGEHWVHAVLASCAVGVATGGALETAAAALATVEPPAGRLSPHAGPGGVTYLRDDWKAPFYTLPPALRVLGQAQAPRKIVVLGALSDYRERVRSVYRRATRDALAVADHVLVVGPNARLVDDAGDVRVRGFATVHEADRFLCAFLRPDDLVLLKGTGPRDHLERLALVPGEEAACWQTSCGRHHACDVCPELHGVSS